ncbi:hypothetical protein BJV78DRAFT_1242139 [Lactifluus subvellereus]|nr:hypothetical protein BJV78DRAFT_1242139 [Lactifluus subvellereus]
MYSLAASSLLTIMDEHSVPPSPANTPYRHHRARLINRFVIPLRHSFWLAHHPRRSVRTRLVTITKGTDEMIVFCDVGDIKRRRDIRRDFHDSLSFCAMLLDIPRSRRIPNSTATQARLGDGLTSKMRFTSSPVFLGVVMASFLLSSPFMATYAFWRFYMPSLRFGY